MNGSRENPIPAVILGGSGYVAGEILRLLVGHDGIQPAAVLSESQAGEPVEKVFPHLAGCYPDLKLSRREDLGDLFVGLPGDRVAIFCAAPHGTAAALLDEVLGEAESAGRTPVAVDLSADFRFTTAEAYQEVYGHPHGAPGRLPSFTCAVPEHLAETPAGHVAHPGCFTTSVLMATVPLLKLGLVEPRISVTPTTGSTGSGRKPSEGTHHPARRSNLYAYNPLRHRHAPEMKALAAAASGVEPEIHFIPQSGPHARAESMPRCRRGCCARCQRRRYARRWKTSTRAHRSSVCSTRHRASRTSWGPTAATSAWPRTAITWRSSRRWTT